MQKTPLSTKKQAPVRRKRSRLLVAVYGYSRRRRNYFQYWSLGQHLRRMLATAGHSWATPEHLVLFGPLARSSRRLPAGLRRWQVGYFALLTAALLAIPAGLMVRAALRSERYVLSAATRQLVGPPVVALDKQLTYDTNTKTYRYNPDAANGIQDTGSQLTIGGSKYYGVDLAATAHKGQTFTDAQTKLSFKLIPQFGQLNGKHVDGHLVYPFDHGQVVYTLKDNGLKEDVVITKPTDSVTLKYQLKLPAGLQARLQPDGSVGIYSADPSLFGNISYGSAQDRQAVEKARQTGQKTNLVFEIPAPVIVESGSKGRASNGHASFTLRDNILTVSATNLKSLNYPISIDPSVIVQNANSFALGNDEDSNANIAASVNRGTLTGGTVSSWTTAGGTSFVTARMSFGTAVYNGYIYIIGGNMVGGGATNTVEYAQITVSGTIGAWSTTTALPDSKDLGNGVVAYNGYIYVMGGQQGATNSSNNVWYAAVCTGKNLTTAFTTNCAGSSTPGSLSSWAAANTGASFSGRFFMSTAVYNGYMYVLAGCTSSTAAYCDSSAAQFQDVNYARINADGTLGAWATVAGTYGKRYLASAIASQGYLYLMGGCVSQVGNNCAVTASDTWYTKLDPITGAPGAWSSSTNLPSTVMNGVAEAYAGYVYLIGGCVQSSGGPTCNGTTPLTSVYYAAIYADGELGPWSSTTVLSTGRHQAAGVAYKGYLFLLGGCTNNTINCGSGGIQGGSVSASIDGPGTIGAYSATADFDTSGNERSAMGTAVSNGYIYLFGGKSLTDNSVRFSKINADGTITGWGNTTAFTTGRAATAVAAYGGSIYLIGGAMGGNGSAIGNCNSGSSVNWYCVDVQRATVDPGTGQLTWVNTYIYSATGRGWPAAAINNGYLYVMGGVYNNNSSFSTEVDYAKINTDGTLGSFQQTTQPLGTGRGNGVGAVAWGGRIYVVGGRAITTSEYATPTATGDITSWSPVGSNLPVQYTSEAIVGYKGYIYLTGGYGSGGNVLNTTLTARINADGTLGSWVTLPQTFSSARYNHGSVAYNGYLYILGGCNSLLSCGSGNVFKDVQYARINNGGPGTVGSWTSATALPATTAHMRSVVRNGYLYVIGGQSDVATTFNYTGSVQTYTVPAGITELTIAAYGGQGGTGAGGQTGGLGGYSQETISVTPGEVLRINVGGQGGNGPTSGTTPTPGGWNGGGTGGINTSNGSASGGGGGGGGATDVRQGGTALSNRVLVAGGGGGGGAAGSIASGGSGGDTNGVSGASNTAGKGGGGATQSAGGIAGVSTGGGSGVAGGSPTQDQGGAGGKEGQLAAINGGGGGGGGYWGGGGGGDNNSSTTTGGGGGGSGYVLPAAMNKAMQTGVQSGNGKVSILLPTYFNNVEYAKLTATGAIASDSGCGSTWCSTTGFSNGRSDFAAEVYGDYLYVLGGDSTGTYYNDVQYAKLTATGAIAADSGCGSAWCTTSSFGTARSSISSAINNGYLYLLGGFDGTNASSSVQYAKLTATGAIASDSGCGSTWCTTSSFTTARMDQTSIANNGYLYVLGGTNASGSTYYNDVQYAKLTATGAIAADSGCGSAWCTTSSFPTARNVHNSWVYNGYLYIAGGYAGSAYTNDVELAPISSNGAIGNWQATTGLGTAGGSSSSAVYGGYVYILGGCTAGYPCTTFTNNVQYAPLNSMPRIAHYSRLIDLKSTINGNTGSDPQITRYRLVGTSNPSVLGPSNLGVCTAGATKANPVFSSSTCTGTVSLGTDLSNKSFGRYAFVYITLDDSRSATFPDATQSSLSELDVYFRASPDRRMRGGKTSTDMDAGQTVNGIPLLQQLDTNGTF